MGTLLTILITAAIAGWFGYSLYRMWRGASGRDCASCALGAVFDYALYNDKKTAPPKAEFVTAAGHHIIVDEAAARRRRERIRKMMEGR
ncbi:hypothetical protein [uncultured Dialister sp.]|uniref:hypothetical protein n=1 Tax=Dialister succinatiphilus TaxID=487173 RepID=UPI0026703CD9|nr:hypothetical protein [uncultured Dialister sp.]